LWIKATDVTINPGNSIQVVVPFDVPPRRFGQLQNLSVPDTFDDPITDAEIAAWEGDSPSYAAGGISGQP
jgi:hypothetical protein